MAILVFNVVIVILAVVASLDLIATINLFIANKRGDFKRKVQAISILSSLFLVTIIIVLALIIGELFSI